MYSAKPILAFCFCLLLVSVEPARAQQPQPQSAPVGSATVSGHLEVDGGTLAGLTLMLQRVPDKPVALMQAAPLTAVSDADGNYRFANVPAGKYSVQVYAPVYVVERNEGPGSAYPDVVVEDGANIQNLNFKLRRGGVITGKLTDPEGRPLIEESITVRRQNEKGKAMQENYESSGALLAAFAARRTDDRGIYRIFGLSPGRYLVSAGAAPGALNAFAGGKSEFKATYYPGTANEAQARFVEVRAGVEAENIDFALLRADAKKGYFASGRVIEVDTGNPVAGLMVFYAAKGAQPGGTNMGVSNATTNSQGEFRFENLAPGSYALTVTNLAAFTGGSNNELYADPLPFEISNSDAAGLVLKMSRGTTLSGSVVIEASPEPQTGPKLAGLMVVGRAIQDSANPPADTISMMSGVAMATANPDGTFQLKGLRPGKYELRAQSAMDQTLKQLRTEQNGVPVNTVEVAGLTPVTNVRLVLGIGSAAISGRVEVRGGTLPPGAQILVIAREGGSASATQRSNNARVDASGKFSLDGLLPGVYEIGVASIRLPGNQTALFESPKQTLTLGEKARQEIVLTLELKEKEKEQ